MRHFTKSLASLLILFFTLSAAANEVSFSQLPLAAQKQTASLLADFLPHYRNALDRSIEILKQKLPAPVDCATLLGELPIFAEGDEAADELMESLVFDTFKEGGKLIPEKHHDYLEFFRYREAQSLDDLQNELVFIDQILPQLENLKSSNTPNENLNPFFEVYDFDGSSIGMLLSPLLRGDGCQFAIEIHGDNASFMENCD